MFRDRDREMEMMRHTIQKDDELNKQKRSKREKKERRENKLIKKRRRR